MVGSQFRQAHRQAGAADDHLGARFNRGLYKLFVVGKRDHHVNADDAVGCDSVSLAQFFLECFRVGVKIVAPVVKFAVEADTGGGYNSNSAAFGDISSKAAGGYTDPHPSLDQGISDYIFSNS